LSWSLLLTAMTEAFCCDLAVEEGPPSFEHFFQRGVQEPVGRCASTGYL
jgi:hypothetical protein